MHANPTTCRWIFKLFCFGCLTYIFLMATGTRTIANGNTAGGLAGPALAAPPPNAYARDIQKKAGSKSQDDLREVGRTLISEQDLLRLNSAQEYAELPPEKLAVHAILARLSRNPAPAATEAITSLFDNKPFLAEQARVECLLMLLPKVRPFPEKALPLLRKSTGPESDSLEIAIRVLFEIGEKSTLDIFAAQVLNDQQDFVLVQGWMRDPLLRHRREPAVLQMCLDLLQQSKLESDRKNSLVEALYDYRPEEWYTREAPSPKPPSSKNLQEGAGELLKKIVAVIADDPAVTASNKALAAK